MGCSPARLYQTTKHNNKKRSMKPATPVQSARGIRKSNPHQFHNGTGTQPTTTSWKTPRAKRAVRSLGARAKKAVLSACSGADGTTATREHRAVQIPRQGTSGHWGDLGSRSSRIRRPGGARQLNSGRAFGRNKTLPDLQAIVIDQELNQTRSQTLKP